MSANKSPGLGVSTETRAAVPVDSRTEGGPALRLGQRLPVSGLRTLIDLAAASWRRVRSRVWNSDSELRKRLRYFFCCSRM